MSYRESRFRETIRDLSNADNHIPRGTPDESAAVIESCRASCSPAGLRPSDAGRKPRDISDMSLHEITIQKSYEEVLSSVD